MLVVQWAANISQQFSHKTMISHSNISRQY
uniref:Uncharacterized protein n=1 Tax=Arundo donax TaxID=35708 RepID=A0A0A9H204_ARUDO